MPIELGAIVRIARKELREIARSGQLRWAAVIVSVLFATSLLLGWRGQQRIRAERDAAEQVARAQWDRQPPKNPHTAAHYGMYLFKPRPILSYFDEGITRWAGVSVYLVAHIQKTVANAAAEDATTALRFGTLSPASVLQLFVPLLVILLASPMFAVERERGTLKQLLSLGIHPTTLLVGKATGAAVALLALLLPALAVGIAIMWIGAGTAAVVGHAPRLLLMAATYAAYATIWLLLSLAISAWAKTGRAALVSLMGFWLFSSIVAPRVGADVAKHAFRPPVAVDLEAQILNEIGSRVYGQRGAQRVAVMEAQVLAQYGVERVEDLPISLIGAQLQAGEDTAAVIIDEHYDRLWATFERQHATVRVLALAAPFIAIRSLSQGLAGTDVAHHRHFAQAAEQYRRRFVRVLNDDITRNASNTDYARYRGDVDLWRRAPTFSYAPPPLREVLRNTAVDAMTLGGWLVASLLAAVLAVRRGSLAD